MYFLAFIPFLTVEVPYLYPPDNSYIDSSPSWLM